VAASTRTETAMHQAGAIYMLPEAKLLVTTYAKAGSTMMKWVMLRISGRHSAATICNNFTNEHWHTARDRTNGWAWAGWSFGPKLTRSELWNSSIHDAFCSPEWTTLAVIRDPWRRAVSMYHDQIARGFYDGTFNDRDDFLRFLQSYQPRGSHTQDLHRTGLFGALRYDFVLDIDHSPSWSFLEYSNPTLYRVMSTGWEECKFTKGRASLLERSKSPHRIKSNSSPDWWLCNETTLSVCSKRFAYDYATIRIMLPSMKFVSDCPQKEG